MKYIKSLYTAIVVLLLIACQSEQWEGQEGGFIVSLGEDVTVSTKSTPAELGKPDPELFKLKIVKESNGNTLYDGNFTGKTIPASAGLYTLTATCGDNPVLALDAPYYKGEESGVEVTEGETTPLELKCSVANALTSVIYDEPEKFNDLYSSYSLKIAIDNQSVTIGPSQTYKSAYYQAGTIPVFQFVGTLKDNGQEVSTTLDDERLKNAATFAAGKHCKLTLKVKPTESGVILTVGKVEVETVSISETIPVEWLPAPKISATGFDESKTLTIYETGEAASATIDFTVSQPLQDVSFTLNFEDENLKALNKDYQLSTMTDEEKIALTDVGISLPLIGSNAPKISFSEVLTSQLLSKNEGVVNNQITINSVTANNRTNTDGAQTYTIAVHKPEFFVSVLPGNIWTKEFTVEEITVEEGKGNAETIKENLVYQYLDTDGIWKDCNNQETHQQVFMEHPQNRTYKVRALYREVLASNEVSVELEEPKALPNGNMNEWLSSTRYKQPYYQPWSNEAWWDTNNNVTMPKSYLTYPNYKCFPTTTYTELGVSGKAAIIRSVAVDGANSEIMGNGANRGILYAGITSDDGTITEGREWTSRPSQLEFMYQYESYDNEHFGAYIELLSGDGTKIASGEYLSDKISTSSYKKANITLIYTNEILKASILKIRFVSVADGESVSTRKQKITIPAGSYQIYGGSVLTIDDISLIYDK